MTFPYEMLDIIKQIAAQVANDCGTCRAVTNLGKYQDAKHLPVISGERLGN